MLVAMQEVDEEAKQWLQEESQKLGDDTMYWELDSQKLTEDLAAERVGAIVMKESLKIAFEKERKEFGERIEQDRKECELRLQQEKQAFQVKLQQEQQVKEALECHMNDGLA